MCALSGDAPVRLTQWERNWSKVGRFEIDDCRIISVYLVRERQDLECNHTERMSPGYGWIPADGRPGGRIGSCFWGVFVFGAWLEAASTFAYKNQCTVALVTSKTQNKNALNKVIHLEVRNLIS